MIGIYGIKNLITGKMYIGKSVNIDKRISNHFSNLRGGNHHSEYLQRSFNKHGELCFIGGTIEICNKSVLNERERYWVKYYDSYNNGYNGTIPTGLNQGHEWGEREKIKLSSTMKEYHSTLSKKKRKDKANHMRSFVDYSKIVHKSPLYSWKLYNKDTLELEHEFNYTKDFLTFIGKEKRKHIDTKLNRIWKEKGLSYKGFIIVRQGEDLNNLIKTIETRRGYAFIRETKGVLI